MIRAKLLSKSDLNRKYKTYLNFFKPNGTPKTIYQHKPKRKYTFQYHLRKIKDKEIKEKFFKIRSQIKTLYPDIIEEYSKRRITYRKPNGFNLYTLQLHRKNMWLGIKGKIDTRGYTKFFNNGFSYLRINNKTGIKSVSALKIRGIKIAR